MVKWFLSTCAAILMVTGLSKLVAIFGGARTLDVADPIFGLPFRYLLLLAGLTELLVAYLCLATNKTRFGMVSVAWLATMLIAYRLGLSLVGWHKPCSCLGNLTDALHIPPHVADIVMKIILVYLLIGSYGILFHQWCKRKAEGRTRNEEIKPELGIGS